MLRVKVFAAAMDMIAAGTSAPIPMAAKEIPANQGGNCWFSSAGTMVLPSLLTGLVPAAIAMKPSSDRKPSISE